MKRLAALKTWQAIALVTAVYFLAAKLGLNLALTEPEVSLVWPASGIGLAAILLFGYRAWPGILIGEFLSNLTVGIPPLASLGMGIGNVFEGVVGAYLFHRCSKGPWILDRAQDTLCFLVFCGLLSPALSATIGTISLTIAREASWQAFGELWRTWWLGDVIGIIVVAPAVASWFEPQGMRPMARPLESLMIMALVALASLLVFGGFISPSFHNLPIAHIIVPFLILGAFRCSHRCLTHSLVLTASIAVLGSLRGYGSFVRENPSLTVMLLQIFIGVTASSMLLLGAALTETREAAEKNAALEKAQELNKLKDHFLSTISHEMKTPLSMIRGYAELLEDQYPDQPLIAGILEGGQRLNQHLSNILDYNSLLSGSLPIYKTELSIAEVFEQVAHIEASAIEAAGQSLSLEIPTDQPIVCADSRRLTQVLQELVENARKFTPAGGQVGLRAAQADGEVEIAVWDTGKGIPQPQLESIWNAFTQLEIGDAVRVGGLGLGLAIVKQLVELHGGRVEVRSEVGKGSCFSIFLPAHC